MLFFRNHVIGDIVRIKSITKNDHQLYSITYKSKGFFTRTKKRNVFSLRDESTNWFWFDTGAHVGAKLSRVLSGFRARKLDYIEN